MARKKEKLAKRVRTLIEKWRGNFRENINQYHEMHDFVLGQQWSKEEQDEMIQTFRKVPLQSNKLGTKANSLLGEQQQNTPQLQVVPMTNCDNEVATIRELITKDIMFSNHSNSVYQVAAGQAAIGGFSAFGIETDYLHARSFDQDIKTFYFKDATRAYFDLSAEHINKIDGEFSGYISRMSRTKFRQVHGREVEENIGGNSAIAASEQEVALAVEPSEGEDPFNWSDAEAITIIHHFERKYVKDTLYKLSNGHILNQEEMDDLIEYSRGVNQRNDEIAFQEMLGLGQSETDQAMLEQDPMQMEQDIMPQFGADGFGMQGNQEILPKENGMEVAGAQTALIDDIEIEQDPETMTLWDEGQIVRIEEKRPSKRHKIVHYQIAGDYLLDETEFASESLPIIFMDNNSYYDKSGKQICRSFFGDAKDTQRYINYLRTQSAYILKVSRYDQWIGSKKNVASPDTRRNWADPTNTQGMLTYDESPSGAKPEPIRPPELSASLTQQYQIAVDDLYTSTGLYPARMGNNGDEASGVAIDARTRQGSYTTYVFFNSVNRAIAAAGQVINEMIPRVYDTERVIALMTPDEGMKNITINAQSDDYGEHIENDIRKGTYQVRLLPGPSYEGQKEQALHSLREILQADPAAFNLIADLYADNLPLANTIEIKNRLKTLVSPQVIEAGKTGQMPDQSNQPPSPEQQAAQADAQFKQAQIEIKKQELQIKQQEFLAEIEIEKMKLQIAEMELAGGIEEQRMRYLAESDRTQSDNAIAHADNFVKLMTHKVD